MVVPVHPEPVELREQQDGQDREVLPENEEKEAKMDLQVVQDSQEVADREVHLGHLENREHREGLGSRVTKVTGDHRENQDYQESKEDQVRSLPFA